MPEVILNQYRGKFDLDGQMIPWIVWSVPSGNALQCMRHILIIAFGWQDEDGEPEWVALWSSWTLLNPRIEAIGFEFYIEKTIKADYQLPLEVGTALFPELPKELYHDLTYADRAATGKSLLDDQSFPCPFDEQPHPGE